LLCLSGCLLFFSEFEHVASIELNKQTTLSKFINEITSKQTLKISLMGKALLVSDVQSKFEAILKSPLSAILNYSSLSLLLELQQREVKIDYLN
jgi:hypothetical protein